VKGEGVEGRSIERTIPIVPCDNESRGSHEHLGPFSDSQHLQQHEEALLEVCLAPCEGSSSVRAVGDSAHGTSSGTATPATEISTIKEYESHPTDTAEARKPDGASSGFEGPMVDDKRDLPPRDGEEQAEEETSFREDTAAVPECSKDDDFKVQASPAMGSDSVQSLGQDALLTGSQGQAEVPTEESKPERRKFEPFEVPSFGHHFFLHDDRFQQAPGRGGKGRGRGRCDTTLTTYAATFRI
jgi:hypothetical protein